MEMKNVIGSYWITSLFSLNHSSKSLWYIGFNFVTHVNKELCIVNDKYK